MTTPHKALLIQALKALKNSIAIRNNEGGTTYGPSLEIPAIAALQAAIDTPEPEPEPEPVAWMNNKRDMTYFGHYNKDDLPLFAAAGAAPKPTKTVDRAWSRFCGCIGRGPDAPYPGMIEAFESHYGQNFTDKDWRNETGIWAAAWGYATRQAGAAPVPEPEGWQPIETAPKGSKAILVHCSERKNTYVATWRLNDEFPWSGKWALFGGDLLNEVPTHWMSLPAAPKEPT